MEIKYPHISVKLTGEDGNAFFIIGKCIKMMRRARCSQEQIDEFQKEATSGSYDHVLGTVMSYFDVH